MTPEQLEEILASNAKAIEANSNAIAESRRETAALYNICSELVRNTSELARDRAVIYSTRLGNFTKKREQKKSKVKNEIEKINLSDDSPGRSAEINS